MEDKRNILRDTRPFAYKILGYEKAQISYMSRLISIVAGKDFQKLKKAIQNSDEYELQLCMAKITRNFKHGNERGGR
jgi:hypothetical protein